MIGLHASYDSYKNLKFIKKEIDLLKKVLRSLNISQEQMSSRMHYLRWKTPNTINNLNSAGIKKDTTLGYADHAGFRCGTCHSYSGYDLILNKILDIKIEPLVIMDSTLFGKNYMNLTYDSAYELGID